ncbi:MAG: HAD-IIA family hydrolase [Armatimonadota bacterium]|nr:HAD-IIA family hydrolase [Armatimonadota bacterium]MDR7450323.1 HAD-IIA family hydrolase [Armatimonadota bacterium]MDR7467094.1 HAD-IIA family hydrolase [Armatimonadota bacterium]MDR7493364.1 HAD-IIA family hydrolase [Armatimonadota bacterium]MDR7499372.1 HAD-IIA family hydrolase [Armatimonadota bacterium]
MTSRRPLRLFAGYVFDLDGTVYLGDRPLPGAKETVARLRELGRTVVFLSNNPLHTREEYASKLTRLGIPTDPEAVVNSSYVLVRHLRRTAGGARLLVLGEESVRRELRSAGLVLTEDPRWADIVVACFDRTFDYRKLHAAFQAIRRGARFIATNRDPYCPTPGGGLPDCGAIVAAIETATGHPLDEVVGKPSAIMAGVIRERLGGAAQDSLMVGDRLETDLALAKAAGMASAIVLTGATDEAALERWPEKPDFVLEGIAEVLPA